MSDASATARALREAFDRSFAGAPADAADTTRDVLAIRIGGDPHAILVSDIVALHADRKTVAIPTRAVEVVGIAGFRHGLVAVVDLATLLGYPRADAPRWLAVARGAEPLALAFETLEGHVRVTRDQVSTSSDVLDASRPFVRGAVRSAGLVRPLVHVAGVVEALTRRAAGAPEDR